MDPMPAVAAQELREEMLEILKQLNRVEAEEIEVEGLELQELHRCLRRVMHPRLTAPEVQTAVNVLVGNGFARQLTDMVFAWDRGRLVGERFAITTAGKAYLLESLRRVNRIE
jgi:hypothetical protein